MGSGSYSHESYQNISSSRGFAKKSINETFSNHSTAVANCVSSFNTNVRQFNTDIDQKMINVGVRQSVDSEEHPNTTPIIIGFDVTGSMGRIPYRMIKEQLPAIMDALTEAGVPDPQILFMAFGDQYSDTDPIQVTQFESDTEKIVNGLQSLYLERGGGGNGGESPTLVYLVAGYHTEIDSWYKRGKKGFLFTISDEACHPILESRCQERILGYEKGVQDKEAVDIISKAKEQYHVFHIHVTDGCHSFREVGPSWKELLGDNVLQCNSKELLEIIPQTILKNIDSVETSKQESATEETSTEEVEETPFTY